MATDQSAEKAEPAEPDGLRLLFLDVDGVLNDRTRHANGYTGLHVDKMELLADVLKATDARVVISSAWRYLVAPLGMTKIGFQNLFLTHGAPKELVDRIIGFTRPDDGVYEDRADQITDWLKVCGLKVSAAVALDDQPLTQSAGRVCPVPCVRVLCGLQQADADCLRVALVASQWPKRPGVIRYHPVVRHRKEKQLAWSETVMVGCVSPGVAADVVRNMSREVLADEIATLYEYLVRPLWHQS